MLSIFIFSINKVLQLIIVLFLNLLRFPPFNPLRNFAQLITIFFVFKAKTEDDTLSLRYCRSSYRTYANYFICAPKGGLEGFKALELQPFATEQRTENVKQQPIICTCLSRTAHTNYFVG